MYIYINDFSSIAISWHYFDLHIFVADLPSQSFPSTLMTHSCPKLPRAHKHLIWWEWRVDYHLIWYSASAKVGLPAAKCTSVWCRERWRVILNCVPFTPPCNPVFCNCKQGLQGIENVTGYQIMQSTAVVKTLHTKQLNSRAPMTNELIQTKPIAQGSGRLKIHIPILSITGTPRQMKWVRILWGQSSQAG